MPSITSTAASLLLACAGLVSAAPAPNSNPNLQSCPFRLQLNYPNHPQNSYLTDRGSQYGNALGSVPSNQNPTLWTLDYANRLLKWQDPKGSYALWVNSARSPPVPGSEGLVSFPLSYTVSQFSPSSYNALSCQRTETTTLKCGVAGQTGKNFDFYSCSRKRGHGSPDFVYLQDQYTADCGPGPVKMNMVPVFLKGQCNPALVPGQH